MKRILSTITLIGIASQLQAMTPTELIQEMKSPQDLRSTPVHQTRKNVRHLERKKHLQKPSATSHRRSIKVHRQKAEKALANKPALRRHFRTLNEYRQLQERPHVRQLHKVDRRAHKRIQAHTMPRRSGRANRYLGNGWYEDEHGQYDEQYTQPVEHRQHRWHHRRHHHGQHAYRHYRRQWYLTYLYERASFRDQHGYLYGYFNRRGFIFEGEFYRYDRAYTYQDRLHGKDLFAHRFYRPIRHYSYEDDDRIEGRGGIYFSWSL